MAHVIATEEDVILLFCEWQMLLPYDVVEDVPLVVCCNKLYWLMLLPGGRWNSHILFFVIIMMADVIAQWQMEWPLQGGNELSTGRCYYQVADGCSWVELF